jgi:hypothetical protein
MPTCSARFVRRDTGSALVLPRADAAAMQLHLEEISRRVAIWKLCRRTFLRGGCRRCRSISRLGNAYGFEAIVL